MPVVASAPVSDDPEEWYGLEYILEMSSREIQPSVTESFSAGGEHSKVNHCLFVSLVRLQRFTDNFQ